MDNDFFGVELEAAIFAFIDHFQNRGYQDSIGNLTPGNVYFGRGETILTGRRRIKQQTIRNRRLNHQRHAAQPDPDEPRASCFKIGAAGRLGSFAALVPSRPRGASARRSPKLFPGHKALYFDRIMIFADLMVMISGHDPARNWKGEKGLQQDQRLGRMTLYFG